MTYILSQDFGKVKDYAVDAIIRRTIDREKKTQLPGTLEWVGEEPPIVNIYQLVYLSRKRKESYSYICKNTKKILQKPQLINNIHHVIDGVGVGVAIQDFMITMGMSPIPIIATGGVNATERDDGGFNVPKDDLYTALAVVMEQRRLQVSPKIDEIEIWKKETKEFNLDMIRAKKKTASSYEDEIEIGHYDTVSAVAMAVWYLEKLYGNQIISPSNKTTKDMEYESWDPNEI